MKSSSYVAYYTYKFFAILIAVFVPVLLYATLFPEHALGGASSRTPSAAETVYALCAVLLLLPLARFMFFRIRVMQYDDEHVEIINGNESRTFRWEEVRRVSKVPAVTPPLYRMTFRDDSEPAYFVMSMMAYASVLFWSWDFTGFYKFAQEKTGGRADT